MSKLVRLGAKFSKKKVLQYGDERGFLRAKKDTNIRYPLKDIDTFCQIIKSISS